MPHFQTTNQTELQAIDSGKELREMATAAQIAGFIAAQDVINTALGIHRQLSIELEQMRADGTPTSDPRFSALLKQWERTARVISGVVTALRTSGINVNVAAVANVGNEQAAVFSKAWDG